MPSAAATAPARGSAAAADSASAATKSIITASMRCAAASASAVAAIPSRVAAAPAERGALRGGCNKKRGKGGSFSLFSPWPERPRGQGASLYFLKFSRGAEFSAYCLNSESHAGKRRRKERGIPFPSIKQCVLFPLARSVPSSPVISYSTSNRTPV